MNPNHDQPVNLNNKKSLLSSQSQSASSLIDAEKLHVGDWATIDGRVGHIEGVHLQDDMVIVITGRERVELPYGSLVERFSFGD